MYIFPANVKARIQAEQVFAMIRFMVSVLNVQQGKMMGSYIARCDESMGI